MSLEVRELIIKAVVVPEGAASGGAAAAPVAGNNDSSPNEELIKTCVEKIMEMIKEQNGR